VAKGASRRRVLLVDPDESFGSLFRSYLERDGWDARWVPDGRDALANWSEFRPQIVVAELQGDPLDGFEFIERLRRFAPTLPIVLCTRLAGVQSWSDAVFAALGVEAVLVRPVRFGQAAWTLEQVLAGLEGGTASLRMPIPNPRG
jgi:DNA-binding response OmpR family regulator